MIRRFGEAVRPDVTYTRRPGAYVILVRGGMVLLTHQADPVPEFQIPGGGIDPGEATLPALHREVLEETGWTMTAPRYLGSFRRFTHMVEYELWAEKVCQVFVAQPVLQKGPPLEAMHTAIWMPPAFAIDAIQDDGSRHFLRRVVG